MDNTQEMKCQPYWLNIASENTDLIKQQFSQNSNFLLLIPHNCVGYRSISNVVQQTPEKCGTKISTLPSRIMEIQPAKKKKQQKT